ncbi:TIGR02234 family membrane protein [Corynebacterium anserum]|uniref:TIGR02234 family membrane protein n=1 Tax=Corynebacterium anserum TaxID=2684406 RepID=A0A7G7YN30_9CORY|nr:TIGR02234 family membrane protein [Corynebacterium anserum]QNH95900.1 TIGR02234 family membrane protein [Corynebacterium anserum]
MATSKRTTSVSKDAAPGAKDALPAASSRVAQRNRRIALLLVVMSAAGLWGTSRMTYVTAHIFDDKSGDSVRNLIGSVWDPATTPLALAMLACLVLSLAMQPVIRRVLGVLIAVLAAVASFRSVALFSSDVDLSRVHDLLASGAATQRQNAPETIAEWAQVTEAQVHMVPVALAIVAAALGIIGGIILAMRPGEKSEGTSRYETPEARRESVHKDLAANPDSGRVLWDALDAGVDPTDEDEVGVDPTDEDEVGVDPTDEDSDSVNRR